MSGSARKEVEKLIDVARAAGWTVERAGSGHYKLRSPAGALVVLPFSPRSGNAFYYSRALLRRHGLAV
jgi:predicted RNA binding protein YcfA (HicA-like mRNA interferase family)